MSTTSRYALQQAEMFFSFALALSTSDMWLMRMVYTQQRKKSRPSKRFIGTKSPLPKSPWFKFKEVQRDKVTINTHRGLFQYNHLPFEGALAPAIFQRHMEVFLQGLDGVRVYLGEVLQHLQQAGMRFNKQKCSFPSP